MKLELKDILGNLDKRNKNYYDNLQDEQKKEFQPFVLMRYMSSVSNGTLSPYAIIGTNEIVNLHFWETAKEKELHAKLLACTGLGGKQFHKWIPANQKSSDILRTFVKEIFLTKGWFCNSMEIDIFLRKCSEDDIEELCQDFGKSKEDTKKLVQHFKKIRM